MNGTSSEKMSRLVEPCWAGAARNNISRTTGWRATDTQTWRGRGGFTILTRTTKRSAPSADPCAGCWPYLVEQQHQAVLQGGGTTQVRVGARSQQPQQRVEDGGVLQQRLMRLADEHLEQLEQRPLAVRVQAAAQVPLHQALQDVLRDHQLQDGAHGRHDAADASAALGGLGGPLLRQQTQHLVGVVPHGRQVVAGGRRLLLLQHPRQLGEKGRSLSATLGISSKSGVDVRVDSRTKGFVYVCVRVHIWMNPSQTIV